MRVIGDHVLGAARVFSTSLRQLLPSGSGIPLACDSVYMCTGWSAEASGSYGAPKFPDVCERLGFPLKFPDSL